MLLILRWAACCCFLGWGWQHLCWDAPYREILWSEDHVGWLLRGLGVSWEAYVGDVRTDQAIILVVKVVGLVYIALAGICLSAAENTRGRQFILLVGGGLLVLLAYAKYLDHLRYWPQALEYSAQVSAPVLLWLALRRGVLDPWVSRGAVVAVSLTFFAHGLYALGYFPTPQNFTTMTMTLLGVSDDGAAAWLRVMGGIDLVIAVGIFIPGARVPLLFYATAWGFMTALARPLAGMRAFYPWWGADQYLHEALYRVPHFALPLFVALVIVRAEMAERTLSPQAQTQTC